MKASTSTSLSVRLYIKAGCHLCEDAEADLARLQRQYPHTLERIEISADPDLQQQYGEQVPVVVLNDREYAAPLSRNLLRRALQEAANQHDQPQNPQQPRDSAGASTPSGPRMDPRSAPNG